MVSLASLASLTTFSEPIPGMMRDVKERDLASEDTEEMGLAAKEEEYGIAARSILRDCGVAEWGGVSTATLSSNLNTRMISFHFFPPDPLDSRPYTMCLQQINNLFLSNFYNRPSAPNLTRNTKQPSERYLYHLIHNVAASKEY